MMTLDDYIIASFESIRGVHIEHGDIVDASVRLLKSSDYFLYELTHQHPTDSELRRIGEAIVEFILDRAAENGIELSQSGRVFHLTFDNLMAFGKRHCVDLVYQNYTLSDDEDVTAKVEEFLIAELFYYRTHLDSDGGIEFHVSTLVQLHVILQSLCDTKRLAKSVADFQLIRILNLMAAMELGHLVEVDDTQPGVKLLRDEGNDGT